MTFECRKYLVQLLSKDGVPEIDIESTQYFSFQEIEQFKFSIFFILLSTG